MGCSEGYFSLHSLLQIRKEHNPQSWVVFVDLIKPFDSIDHKFICVLLEKFVSQIVLFKQLRTYTRISRLN